MGWAPLAASCAWLDCRRTDCTLATIPTGDTDEVTIVPLCAAHGRLANQIARHQLTNPREDP